MPTLIEPEKSELKFLKVLKKHQGYLMDSICNLDEFYRKWVKCRKRYFSLIYCEGCNDFTGFLAGDTSVKTKSPVCYISIDKAYEDVGYERFAFREACRLSLQYGLDNFLLYYNKSVDSILNLFQMESVTIDDDKYYVVDSTVIRQAFSE